MTVTRDEGRQAALNSARLSWLRAELCFPSARCACLPRSSLSAFLAFSLSPLQIFSHSTRFPVRSLFLSLSLLPVLPFPSLWHTELCLGDCVV